MSLLATAFLLAASPQVVVPAVPMTDEEIVVIGRKLRYVQFRFQAKRGKLLFCKITRSAGDKVLDRLTCAAAKVCAAQRPKDVAEMSTCMTGQREQVLAALRTAKDRKGRN